MSIISDIETLYTKDVKSKLEVLIRLTEQQLIVKLNTESLPTKFEYIVTQVSMVRMSRIGSEGYSSESAGGVSVSFLLPENDFLPYYTEINDYISENSTKDFIKGKIELY